MTESVDLDELIAHCNRLSEMRKKEDELDGVLKAHRAEMTKVENIILNVLESRSLTSFDSPVGRVTKKIRTSVKVPKETKEEFLKYLEQKGVLFALASVHSATLNAWYNQEQEAAYSRGELLVIPGLEAPTASMTLSFTAKK